MQKIIDAQGKGDSSEFERLLRLNPELVEHFINNLAEEENDDDEDLPF